MLSEKKVIAAWLPIINLFNKIIIVSHFRSFDGILTDLGGFWWNSLESEEFWWISMDFMKTHWISQDFSEIHPDSA